MFSSLNSYTRAEYKLKIVHCRFFGHPTRDFLGILFGAVRIFDDENGVEEWS